ncbi:MAG TPA: glycine cleavage system aminomethyltransferase GcvT [Terriglobales bacterium]|nr:glycine cleavage system aminomethyltransferase GcvT [Terriglobales bacterium]
MAQVHDGSRPTPLAGRHQALGARIVEFGGWLMPLQYAGILEEHRAVRSRAGLFDLSHMGELFVEGSEAAAALGYALTTEPAGLKVGRAQYSMICFPEGGILDDLIVYRLGEERFMVVANASNASAVSDALAERLAGRRVVLDDRSLATALVAIQGPLAAAILTPLTDAALEDLPYYGITQGNVAGVPALVARTGYTGEDGFEVIVEVAAAGGVWDALLEAGEPLGAVPVGLGARDTLRLEAGMPLYGNELGPDTTPFEAGLGRVVKLAKDGDFVGRAALEKASAEGPRKLLVGLAVRGRGIARHGYDVFAGDRRIGVVTSGTQSPTLGYPIAMAYLTPSEAEPGTIVDVSIRDQRVPAEVVPMPFYRRPAQIADARA